MLENRTHAPHKSTRDHNKELPELYIDRENCCGCSSCYASCPTKAINMKPDEEGFLYPVIDTEKCIGCNKCLSVCAFKNDQKAKGYYRNGEKKPLNNFLCIRLDNLKNPILMP